MADQKRMELENPSEIRVYLISDSALPADPLEKRGGGAVAHKQPTLGLELREAGQVCVIHLSAAHFAFLEDRMRSARRALDELAGGGPAAED